MQLKPNHHYQILDTGNEIQIFNGKQISQEPVRDIHIPADTTVNYFINWQKTSVERHLILHLDEPGAFAEIIGLFTAHRDNNVTLKSTIAHHAPNTNGNCLVKGVLYDNAFAKLSGMIQIDGNAGNSYDQLTERLLVLSNDAQGELQPELEILTNEVKASHATTISHPDTDQLFYLQSRGLDPKISETLLVEGFLQEVYEKIPVNLLSTITNTTNYPELRNFFYRELIP